MKALVKAKPGKSYEYKDVPVPQPGQGELLIKVNKVAICGSDITLYQWGEGKNYLFSICKLIINFHDLLLVAKTIAAIPFTPGHEAVGEVGNIHTCYYSMAPGGYSQNHAKGSD